MDDPPFVASPAQHHRFGRDAVHGTVFERAGRRRLGRDPGEVASSMTRAAADSARCGCGESGIGSKMVRRIFGLAAFRAAALEDQGLRVQECGRGCFVALTQSGVESIDRGGRLETLTFPRARLAAPGSPAMEAEPANDAVNDLGGLQEENAAELRERMEALRKQMEESGGLPPDLPPEQPPESE